MRDTTETIARRYQSNKQIAAIVAASAKVATPERYTQVQQMVYVMLPSRWKFGSSRWENMVWNPSCKLALEEEMPENRDWLSPAQIEIVLAYVLYCLALETGIINLPWNAYMRDLCFEMIEP